MNGQILICYEGSEGAERAVDTAARSSDRSLAAEIDPAAANWQSPPAVSVANPPKEKR